MKYTKHQDRKSYKKWAMTGQRTKSDVVKDGQPQTIRKYGMPFFLHYRTMS